MNKKPTYEELEQRIKELEVESARLKQAEEAILGSKKSLRCLFDSSAFGMIVCHLIRDKAGKSVDFEHLEVNQATQRQTGFKPEQLIGKRASEIVSAELTARLVQIYSKVVETGKPHRYEEYFSVYDRTLQIGASHIEGDLFVLTFVDISERKQAEVALRESEENFRALAENANDGILIAVEDGKSSYANRRTSEITGYSVSELLKMTIRDLAHPDEFEKINKRYKTIIAGKPFQGQYETMLITKDGKEVPIELSSAMFIWHGQPADMVVIRDISERKQGEEKVKASLKEKEMFLREIHHRVKNNLQIISSLLDLRIIREDNQHVIDVFQDTRSKIQTMALIHSQLYESERFDRINMGNYVQNLVNYLSSIFVDSDVEITHVIEYTDVCLSINQAIPCALVLNELISNAFKHAFKGRKKGRVEISLMMKDHNKIVLTVKDNGIGIPEEIDILKTDSLGLKLMRNTVQDQLMGKIHFESGAGNAIMVEFKIVEEEVTLV